MSTRLIVTRPAAQAEPWVQGLAAAGVDAVALPLIGIEAVEDPAPLRAAWASLADCALVMFVSANAVAHFDAARPPGATWPEGLLAGSTGPGTSGALRAAGLAHALVEPDADSAFDSESLWAKLAARDWQGRRVLVVRGEEGRDWFSTQMRSRGAEVRFVAAYRRTLPVLDAAGQALIAHALAAPAAHAWLFSSSQAIRHLQQLAPQADWTASRALATHSRIAEAAAQAGFGSVATLAPRLPDIAASLHRPPIQSAPQ